MTATKNKYCLDCGNVLQGPDIDLCLSCAIQASIKAAQMRRYLSPQQQYQPKEGNNVAYKGGYNRRGGGNPGGVGVQYAPNAPNAAKPTVQCKITWDPSCNAYEVSTPYEPNFVEFIKSKIPGNKRAWNPVSKTWFVDEEYFDVLKMLAVELWQTTGVRFIRKKKWRSKYETATGTTTGNDPRRATAERTGFL
jgi:transcription elongation factor